jgi:hypothetical protein
MPTADQREAHDGLPRMVRKADLLESAIRSARALAIIANEMPRVLDPFRFVLIAVAGWMNQRQLQMIDYLREENRVLREQLGRGDSASTTASAVDWPLRPEV